MTTGSKSRDLTRKKDPQQLLMLTKIRQLLKNEFAFDGYMNHGQEDLDMGKCVTVKVRIFKCVTRLMEKLCNKQCDYFLFFAIKNNIFFLNLTLHLQ